MSVGVLSGFKEVFNLHYNDFPRIEMDGLTNQSEIKQNNHCRSGSFICGDFKDDSRMMTELRSDEKPAGSVASECTINLSGRGFTGSLNMTLGPHLEIILLGVLRRFAEIIGEGRPQSPALDVDGTDTKEEIGKCGEPDVENSAGNPNNSEVSLFHCSTQTSQFVDPIIPNVNRTSSYHDQPSISSHVPVITPKQSSFNLIPLVETITPKLSSRNLHESVSTLTLERHQGFDTVKSSATDNLSSRPNLMFNGETKVKQNRGGAAYKTIKYRDTTTDSSSQFHGHRLSKRKRIKKKIRHKAKAAKPELEKSCQKPSNKLSGIVPLTSPSSHLNELKCELQKMTNSNEPQCLDQSLNLADSESLVKYKEISMHIPTADTKSSCAKQSKRFVDSRSRKEPLKAPFTNKEQKKDSRMFLKQNKQSNTTCKFKSSSNLECTKYKTKSVRKLKVLNHEKCIQSISNKNNLNVNFACTEMETINNEDFRKCEKLQKKLSNLINMFDCILEKASTDELQSNFPKGIENNLEKRNLAIRKVDMDDLSCMNFHTKSIKKKVLPKSLRSVVKWFGKLPKFGNFLVDTNKCKSNENKSKTKEHDKFKFLFKNKNKISVLPSTVQMLKSDIQFYSMSDGWRQDRHSFQRDKSPRYPRRERVRSRGEDEERWNLDEYCNENCPKVCRDYYIRIGRDMAKRRRRSSSADFHYRARYRLSPRFSYYHSDDSSSHYGLDYDSRPRREHHRKMALIRYHPEFSSSQDSFSDFGSSTQDEGISEIYGGSPEYRSDHKLKSEPIRRSIDAEVQTDKKKLSSGKSKSSSSKSSICKYKLKRCSHRRKRKDDSFASCICKKKSCCGFRKRPKPNSSKRLRWRNRSKRFSCCAKKCGRNKSGFSLKDDSTSETLISNDCDKASDKTYKSRTKKFVGSLFKKSKHRKNKTNDKSKSEKSLSTKKSSGSIENDRKYEVNIALGIDSISDDSLEEPKCDNIVPKENKEQVNQFLHEIEYDKSPFETSINRVDCVKGIGPSDPTTSRGTTIQKKAKHVKQFFINKFKTLTKRKTSKASSVEFTNSPFIYREETHYDYNQNQDRKRPTERNRVQAITSHPNPPTDPNYRPSVGQESRPRYSSPPDHHYAYYRGNSIDMPPMNPYECYDRCTYSPIPSNCPMHYNQFPDPRRSHDVRRSSTAPEPIPKVRNRDICHKCKIKSGEPLSEILIRRSKSPNKHNENVVRARRVILEDFPSKQFADVGTQYESDSFQNVDRICEDECFLIKRRPRSMSPCKDKSAKREVKERAACLPRPSPPRDPQEAKRNSLILFQDRNTYLLKPAEIKRKQNQNKRFGKKKESTPSSTTLCSTPTTIDTCSTTSTICTPKKKKRHKYKCSSSDEFVQVKTKCPPKKNKKKSKSKKQSILRFDSSECIVNVKQKKKSKDRRRRTKDERPDRNKPYVFNCIKPNNCVPENVSLLNDVLLRNKTYSTAPTNSINCPTIQDEVNSIRQRGYTWKNNQCLPKKGLIEPNDCKRNPTVNVAILKTASRDVLEAESKTLSGERKCVENSEILIDKFGLPVHNKAETAKTLLRLPKPGVDSDILSDECQHFQKILNVTKIINRMKNIKCTQEAKRNVCKNQRSEDS